MEYCKRTPKRCVCLTPLSGKVCEGSGVLGGGAWGTRALLSACVLCLDYLNEEHQTGSNLFKILKKLSSSY